MLPATLEKVHASEHKQRRVSRFGLAHYDKSYNSNDEGLSGVDPLASFRKHKRQVALPVGRVLQWRPELIRQLFVGRNAERIPELVRKWVVERAANRILEHAARGDANPAAWFPKAVLRWHLPECLLAPMEEFSLRASAWIPPASDRSPKRPSDRIPA